MNFKKLTALACAGILVAAVATPLAAQTMVMGDDAIAKRKELMKSNGGTLRGAGSATGPDAVAAGEKLVANMAELAKLWPADSQGGASKTKPEAWNADGTLSEGFLAAFTTASEAAQAVLDAANAGDTAAYGAALKAMGGSCGGCHGTYQIK